MIYPIGRKVYFFGLSGIVIGYKGEALPNIDGAIILPSTFPGVGNPTKYVIRLGPKHYIDVAIARVEGVPPAPWKTRKVKC